MARTSFNSTQKDALAQAIFHRLVLEYITCVYKFLSEEQADKKMHEACCGSVSRNVRYIRSGRRLTISIVTVRSSPCFADIAHTKDGACGPRTAREGYRQG